MDHFDSLYGVDPDAEAGRDSEDRAIAEILGDDYATGGPGRKRVWTSGEYEWIAPRGRVIA
jgi:hypothetical protein